jgi:hypothetical protein
VIEVIHCPSLVGATQLFDVSKRHGSDSFVQLFPRQEQLIKPNALLITHVHFGCIVLRLRPGPVVRSLHTLL